MNSIFELKATGEKIEVRQRAENKNAVTEMVITLPASGYGPPTHRHPLQSEFFEALEGEICIEAAGQKFYLKAGDNYTVSPDLPHRCYAVNGATARCRVVFSPGLHIAYLLEEIVASCNRRNARYPSPFDACYVLGQAQGQYYLQAMPLWIQQHIFPLVARVGLACGWVKARPFSK